MSISPERFPGQKFGFKNYLGTRLILYCLIKFFSRFISIAGILWLAVSPHFKIQVGGKQKVRLGLIMEAKTANYDKNS